MYVLCVCIFLGFCQDAKMQAAFKMGLVPGFKQQLNESSYQSLPYFLSYSRTSSSSSYNSSSAQENSHLITSSYVEVRFCCCCSAEYLNLNFYVFFVI